MGGAEGGGGGGRAREVGRRTDRTARRREAATEARGAAEGRGSGRGGGGRGYCCIEGLVECWGGGWAFGCWGLSGFGCLVASWFGWLRVLLLRQRGCGRAGALVVCGLGVWLVRGSAEGSSCGAGR